jgi:hypothetical protein
MVHAFRRSLVLLVAALLVHCAQPLPGDIADYRERCVPMNCDPISVKSDDPHEGEKDVFACDVPEAALLDTLDGAPFPEGSIIVKESTRRDSNYPWLVATARKKSDGWQWDEYSRNFENEEFLHIAAGEDVCIDCHRKARVADWIYTVYEPADTCQ